MTGEVEDVDHFLIGCTEFGMGWEAQLKELRGVEGTGEWLEEFGWWALRGSGIVVWKGG